MNSQTRISRMERAGAWLGHLWRALCKRERLFIRWLIDTGCPAAAAYSLMWMIRLAILGFLFYTSMIIALIVVAALIAGKIVPRADSSSGSPEPEWRYGLLGFGLYDRDGTRVDPHDPNNPHAEP